MAGKALRRAAVTVGETDPSKIEAEQAIRAADRVLGALFHDIALRRVLVWAVVAHASRVEEAYFASGGTLQLLD